jgi:hypothetical protein
MKSHKRSFSTNTAQITTQVAVAAAMQSAWTAAVDAPAVVVQVAPAAVVDVA